MQLVNEMLRKVRLAHDLVETDQVSEASLVLYELELLLDEVPANVEDRIHFVVEEGNLCSQIRRLIHVDKFAALSQLKEIFQHLSRVNQDCNHPSVLPEFPIDIC